MQTKLLLFIAFSSVLVGITSAIVCLPDFCARVDCANLSRESCEADGKSLFKPHGGYCGCCPLCVHLLDEGENCINTIMNGLSVPPTVQCRQGLRCDPETIKCAKLTEYY